MGEMLFTYLMKLLENWTSATDTGASTQHLEHRQLSFLKRELHLFFISQNINLAPSIRMLNKSTKNLFIFLIAEKKPIRKPDPNLRQLQRQISFGSGAPLIGLGSLKKKQMSTGKIIFSNV